MAKNTPKGVQDEIKDSAHKVWLAGLGALATAEEEGGRLFKKLVEKGESLESKGKETVSKAKTKVENAWEDIEGKLDEKVTSVLHRMGVPSRDEIRNLTEKVEDLAAKVEQLAAKKAAAKPA